MQNNQNQTNKKIQQYLGIYLTKGGHELLTEWYKILLTIPGKKYIHS